MTLFRLMPLQARSILLIVVGAGLLLGPLPLGMSAAAIVVGVLAGALVIGVGLAGTATGGRGSIPVSAHKAYDMGFAAGLLLAALAFVLAGDSAASALFAAAGAAQLLIGANTRYSAAPAG